jgi:hypothetical protein
LPYHFLPFDFFVPANSPAVYLSYKLKQKLNPLRFIDKWLRPATQVNCLVKLLVRPDQVGRHGEGTAKIAQESSIAMNNL